LQPPRNPVVHFALLLVVIASSGFYLGRQNQIDSQVEAFLRSRERGFVHYTLTYGVVFDAALSHGLSSDEASALAATVAAADGGVDRIHIGPDLSTWSRIHWGTLAEAEARLQAAVKERDPVAFGRALHALQDYHAHRRQGYTIPGGIGGALVYCLDVVRYDEVFDWRGLWRATYDYGHFLTHIILGPESDVETYGSPGYQTMEATFIHATAAWSDRFLDATTGHTGDERPKPDAR
jgi:hypothetical protein